MNKWLALILDYHSYPVFIMTDKGVVDCALPPEWGDVLELDELLSHIQDTYDSLFISNEKEFRYVGFRTTEEHNKFTDDLLLAIALLIKKNNGQYKIENRLDPEYLTHIAESH